MSGPAASYKRHRFPPAVIAHAVWLHLRFSLSPRAVEELLLERGVELSYESLRRWVAKFGAVIARGLRRRPARPGDVWHLDEVPVRVRGRRFWLWRAVDERGVVLDEILQPHRDRKAAKRWLAAPLEDRRPSAEAHRHRQAAFPCGHQARDRPHPRAPSAQGIEQPRREQPPAVPIAGAGDARPPLARRAAALRRDALRHPQPLCPVRPSSPLRPDHPIPPPRSLRCLARSRRPRRLNHRPQASHALMPLS